MITGEMEYLIVARIMRRKVLRSLCVVLRNHALREIVRERHYIAAFCLPVEHAVFFRNREK
jgi:hypothetical protein